MSLSDPGAPSTSLLARHLGSDEAAARWRLGRSARERADSVRYRAAARAGPEKLPHAATGPELAMGELRRLGDEVEELREAMRFLASREVS